MKTWDIERDGQWVEWQREHAAALEALQAAERAYHRVMTGHAFASAGDGPAARKEQHASLLQVDAARATLDEVRERQPK